VFNYIDQGHQCGCLMIRETRIDMHERSGIFAFVDVLISLARKQVGG